jgi:hypothetical protein
MEKTPGFRPYLILLVLFGISGLLLATTVDVGITDEAGVRLELPTSLGDAWTGHEVVFCHNPYCGRSWLVKDLTPDAGGKTVCPENYRGEPCGGELRTMALGEYQILPKDTVIFKKQYQHNLDPERTVHVAVVLSGEDRTSIHRPETCTQAQGNTIDLAHVIQVPLANGRELGVMVLDLRRVLPGGRVLKSYYAYWFSGKDRDTPHHHERVLWMSLDRVFRSVAHRWAYIAVAGERSPEEGNNAHHAEIREIVALLYPQIRLEELNP